MESTRYVTEERNGTARPGTITLKLSGDSWIDLITFKCRHKVGKFAPVTALPFRIKPIIRARDVARGVPKGANAPARLSRAPENLLLDFVEPS